MLVEQRHDIDQRALVYHPAVAMHQFADLLAIDQLPPQLLWVRASSSLAAEPLAERDRPAYTGVGIEESKRKFQLSLSRESMPRPEAKSLRRPEQVRRFPNGRIDIVSHHETTIGRFSLEPGWRWSRDVGPIAHTHSCQIHHLGVVLKGRLRIETDAGEVCEFEVDDVYDIPPGHDGMVVGDETFEAIEFVSARIFAIPTDGDRVLAAVLCTDIVDSTSHLRRLGDSAWRELLTEHNQQTRGELNRFRGREIQTTGDGFLAVFDGPARAVRCAQAIGSSVGNLGIAIRAGIHTGEVELVGTDVRGVAVHEAARVADAATAGEVLVSATTKLLLAGSGLSFESAGIHQLKGLGDACELFRLAGSG